MSDSLAISSRSLRANILTLPSGHYLTAGQHQFLTLWTRDFCHAVRGLLALDELDTVRDHLSLLLNSLRDDGLVPRVVDNRLVQFRVAWQAGRRLLPFLPTLAFKEPLTPQYVDEHGSRAIDSNLLVLLAALQLKERDEAWWKSHEPKLRRVYDYYQSHMKNGLIFQTPFADWQDSASRQGHAFLTNLFYFLASVRLQKVGWDLAFNGESFRTLLKQKFFVKGIFRSMETHERVSVDGNLFALEAEEFLSSEEKKELWMTLKTHPVVSLSGHIGVCSYPDYSASEIAFHVKLAKLQGYHGHLAWSWLMGLGLKVAVLMKDEDMIQKQLTLIDRVLNRDGEVLEVYAPDKNWQGWESWLVRSERPFAWGSGYLVEGLKSLTS